MPTLIREFSGNPDGELSFLPQFKMKSLGERVALVGQNGAGKTRFLEFLASEIWADQPNSKIIFDNSIRIRPFVAFIPDELVLWNDAHNTQDSLFAEHINRILPTVFSVLKETAKHYALSHIPESKSPRAARRAVQERWATLRDNVSDIMGRDLEISENGNIQLSGVDITEDSLSKGQARLLQISVALSAISENQPIVLIWDEPELHLHPRVVRKVLDVISAKFNCQIWMATHSLSLVSYIGVDSIWYLSPRGVEKGIRAKDELLGELFGGDEQVDQLETFLSPIDELAAVKFAKECLGNPEVVGYAAADPQGSQVFERIKARVAEIKRPLKILDFGAGKGRLTDAARFEFNGVDDLSKVIDYYAYDISDENHEECVDAIGKTWNDAKERWTNELTVLKDRFSSDKADVVSLVNVLHEIPPQDWVKVFKDITSILAEDGRLLIVEDLKLPRGEMPHRQGFLLLTESSIRKLFGDTNREIVFEYKYDGRLMMASVPKSIVSTRIDCLRACLVDCSDRALAEIQDVRRGVTPDFFSGVRHMRAAMQLVNATLSLERIGREA